MAQGRNFFFFFGKFKPETSAPFVIFKMHIVSRAKERVQNELLGFIKHDYSGHWRRERGFIRFLLCLLG